MAGRRKSATRYRKRTQKQDVLPLGSDKSVSNGLRKYEQTNTNDYFADITVSNDERTRDMLMRILPNGKPTLPSRGVGTANIAKNDRYVQHDPSTTEKKPADTINHDDVSMCSWADAAICSVFCIFCLVFRHHFASLLHPSSLQEKNFLKHLANYGQATFFVPSNGLFPLLLLYCTGISNLDSLRTIASISSAVVPALVYFFARQLGCRRSVAVVHAFLVCFDSALFASSQFITSSTLLLPLLLISLITALRLLNLSSSTKYSYGFYSTLMVTGLLISIAICSDLYTVPFFLPIVVFHLYKTWSSLGDSSQSVASICVRLTSKVFWLLIFPLLFHLLLVMVHFQTAHRAGKEAGLFTSRFQLRLQGGLSSFTRHQSLHLTYGSRVTLRSHGRSPPCWLRSEAGVNYPMQYPDGRGSSMQQTVDCNEYKSQQNWWVLERADDVPPADSPDRRVVRSGDRVHLRHGASGRHLHTHNVAAPDTVYLQEVTCFIKRDAVAVSQIDWILIVSNSGDAEQSDGAPVRAIGDRFRLLHQPGSQSGGREVALALTGKRYQLNAANHTDVDRLEVAGHAEPAFYHHWNVEEIKPDVEQIEDKTPAMASRLEQLVEFHQHFWLKLGTETDDTTVEYPCSIVEFLLGDFAYPFLDDRHQRLYLFGIPNITLQYGSTLLAAVFPILVLVSWVLSLRRISSISNHHACLLNNGFVFVFLPCCFYLCLSVLFASRVPFYGNYSPVGICIILLSCCTCESVLKTFQYFRWWSIFLKVVICVWLLLCCVNFLVAYRISNYLHNSDAVPISNVLDFDGPFDEYHWLRYIGKPAIAVQLWLFRRNFTT